MYRTTIICLLSIFPTTMLIGCTSATETTDRQGRLLTLAAAEAQQIPDAQQRLTRQLNFAYRQSCHGQTEQAKQSLAYAAQTLRDAKPGDLHPQIRIAGWVSISELSCWVGDRSTAKEACDQAVAVLRSLEPVTDRPNYVVGVARAVEALSGKAQAAKLLEESADWIKPMQPAVLQRAALVAVCDAIFDDEDFTGGLAVLRTDPDATWRSDVLAMLAGRDYPEFVDANGNVVTQGNGAQQHDWISGVVNAAEPRSVAASPSEFPSSATRSFGKSVDFQHVFKDRLGADDTSSKP